MDKTRFDVMAEIDGHDLYVYALEEFAPQPPIRSDQEAGGVIWTLWNRQEALAMRQRLITAGADVRVFEMPCGYEESGDEEWIPSADGQTLVVKEGGCSKPS